MRGGDAASSTLRDPGATAPGEVQAGPAVPGPGWPPSARALADRVLREEGDFATFECRLGWFAFHEGFGPHALELLHDMLLSDVHHDVREGACSQATLARHARPVCARFDALRSAVNRAMAERPDAVWERVDREAPAALLAGRPAYGPRGRNPGEDRRGGPYSGGPSVDFWRRLHDDELDEPLCEVCNSLRGAPELCHAECWECFGEH